MQVAGEMTVRQLGWRDMKNPIRKEDVEDLAGAVSLFQRLSGCKNHKEAAAKLDIEDNKLYRIQRRGYLMPGKDPKNLIDRLQAVTGLSFEQLYSGVFPQTPAKDAKRLRDLQKSERN